MAVTYHVTDLSVVGQVHLIDAASGLIQSPSNNIHTRCALLMPQRLWQVNILQSARRKPQLDI